MSMRYVVDTNVPIVANGGKQTRKFDRAVSAECRIKAIEFLEKLLKRGRIILDLGGEIQAEYLRHLNPRGQPSVGDRFLQVVLNSGPMRIERVDLGKTDGEFDDFPNDPKHATFDRSDRKFVAAGRKAKASIVNAVDSDWLDHHDALLANNVRVRFICGCDKVKWFIGPYGGTKVQPNGIG
jgi:hypothetical protein